MKIELSTSYEVSEAARNIFSQGADAVVSLNDNQAGLWWSNTPSLDGRRVGTIGACILGEDEEAVGFLRRCSDYLIEEQACEAVVGPMNGNTWLKHRLIKESDGTSPFLMEPWEPKHFWNVFEGAGFRQLSSYSSSRIDLESDNFESDKLRRRMKSKGVEIRPIRLESFESELKRIYQLCLESFQDNFLYTPLSESAFTAAYMKSRDLVDVDFVLLAERAGDLVGFVFCLPDALAPKAGASPALIVKTLASVRARDLAGLGSLLVAESHETARQKGYKQAIHALQHESNSSLRISKRFDAEVFRRYALMVKYPEAL